MNVKYCDRCGNEANFFWRMEINGRVKEVALCHECAAAEKRQEEHPPVEENPWNLATLRRASLETKLRLANKNAPVITEEQKTLPTLKAELKRALRREDYLAAARLRDQIRVMEGGNQK